MTHLEVKDTYLNNMHVQYNRRILRFIKGIVRAQKNTINCYLTININVFTRSKWILHKKHKKIKIHFGQHCKQYFLYLVCIDNIIYTLKKQLFLTDIVIFINDQSWLGKDLLTPLYQNGHGNRPFEVNNERE